MRNVTGDQTGIQRVMRKEISLNVLNEFRKQNTGLCLEAIIGISYALAAAFALFLVGNSPGGHTHILNMLSGSILWIKPGQIATLALVIAGMILVALLFGKSFTELSQAYENGNKKNWNSFLLDVLFYLVAGTVIAVAVNAVGVVLVFTLLIFPALFGDSEQRGVNRYLTTVIITGITGSSAGFLVALGLDLPPAVCAAAGVGVVGATVKSIGTIRSFRH